MSGFGKSPIHNTSGLRRGERSGLQDQGQPTAASLLEARRASLANFNLKNLRGCSNVDARRGQTFCAQILRRSQILRCEIIGLFMRNHQKSNVPLWVQCCFPPEMLPHLDCTSRPPLTATLNLKIWPCFLVRRRGRRQKKKSPLIRTTQSNVESTGGSLMITSHSLIKHSKTGTEGALRVTNSLLLLLQKPNPTLKNEISVCLF